MDAQEFLSDSIQVWSANTDSDDELDELLLAASQEYENETVLCSNSTTTPTLPHLPVAHLGRYAAEMSSALCFAPPQSEEEVVRSRGAGIPESTKKDTEYCVRIWEEWSRECTGTTIPPLTTMPASQLSFLLTHFILEDRKKSYPPNSLHHIIKGLMWYLRRWVWTFSQDAEFQDFEHHLTQK
jgi:hypothetical protein